MEKEKIFTLINEFEKLSLQISSVCYKKYKNDQQEYKDEFEIERKKDKYKKYKELYNIIYNYYKSAINEEMDIVYKDYKIIKIYG